MDGQHVISDVLGGWWLMAKRLAGWIFSAFCVGAITGAVLVAYMMESGSCA